MRHSSSNRVFRKKSSLGPRWGEWPKSEKEIIHIMYSLLSKEKVLQSEHLMYAPSGYVHLSLVLSLPCGQDSFPAHHEPYSLGHLQDHSHKSCHSPAEHPSGALVCLLHLHDSLGSPVCLSFLYLNPRSGQFPSHWADVPCS